MMERIAVLDDAIMKTDQPIGERINLTFRKFL